MTKYRVDFSYSVPEWGDIELVADSPDEAEDIAREEFARNYPEAIDFEIDHVQELTDGK